jgi:hypothetical protein
MTATLPQAPATVPPPDWAGFGPHRALGATDWRVWSVGLLRSAGFPVEGLGWTAGRRAAAAALDDFVAAYEADCEDESAALAAIAGDESLRAAVAWQNRSVYAVLAKLADRVPQKAMKRRQRERSLAMYWQRYCSKAETIGSFGPAAWMAVGDSAEAITVVPGPALVAERVVCLERWTITEIGTWMAEQPGARWWFPPILRPDVHLDPEAGVLLVPGRGPLRLRAGEAEVLALADGHRHGQDIADELGRTDVEQVLTRYQRQRLLTWDANIPVDDRAEETLRARVARIGDPELAARFATLLDELATARERVAAAACTDDLVEALDALDTTWVAVPGVAATRDGGRSYAGRTLSYHDAIRGCESAIGQDFLDRVADPLALVATAGDWFGNRVAELVEQEVTDLVRTAAARSRRPVTLADVWASVLGLFWGDDPRPVKQAIAELSARWAQVLDVPEGRTEPVRRTAAELAPRIAAAFGDEPCRWPHLGVHSPDLQIAAPSVDAVNAGDYEIVLGELHACLATLDTQFLNWMVPGYPEQGSLRDRINAAIGATRFVPLFPVGWRRNSGRFVPTGVGAADRLIGFSRAPVRDRDNVVPSVAITLTASEDGPAVATLPDGTTARIPELLGVLISMVAADAFKIGLDRPHAPRLAIDDLVVFRESWRLPVTSIELPVNADRHRDYLAVRAWVTRAGLPDEVFVKFPEETKPALFDLTSPTLVLSFANLARAALRRDPDAVIGISEPLPHPRDSWLPDAAGRRYVSEVRIQISRELPR